MRIEIAKLPSRAERTQYRLCITSPNRIQLHNTYEHKTKKRTQADSRTNSINPVRRGRSNHYISSFVSPPRRPPAYSARKRFLDLTTCVRTYICRYLDRYNKPVSVWDMKRPGPVVARCDDAQRRPGRLPRKSTPTCASICPFDVVFSWWCPEDLSIACIYPHTHTWKRCYLSVF